MSSSGLRNVAIIAHVDHGKTTLVDKMLVQGGAYRENEGHAERAMDSNPLERERGITILAKCTSVVWDRDGVERRINVIDTPGHADFGGEVERILSMVDGCVLLIDACEGPMPQTKFVLGKALKLGLRPIVCLNKADRPNADPDKALNDVFDLFAALDATDEQLDFPYLYASGKEGWATNKLEDEKKDLAPLFNMILDHVPPPPPSFHMDEPFRMLATTLDADAFVGRTLTGRIESGRIEVGRTVKAMTRDGKEIERARLTKLFAYRGLKRVPVESAEAGDIVAIAGLGAVTVSDTICDLEVTEPVFSNPIDPPTLAIIMSVNDSPMAGREGSKVQSRVIRERLYRQAEGDVAIKVSESEGKDAFEVAGRGELQLGVLIETMRREGFEMTISRPRVLTMRNEEGKLLEPIEEVTIDVDENFAGPVIEKISLRRGEMKDMRPSGGGKQRIVFHAPSRGLVGYHGEFMTDTRGEGVMNRVFYQWGDWRGEIPSRHTGAIISTDQGNAVAYALWFLEDRGALFIDPGEAVYEGMIIGENPRGEDMDVNPLKEKKLSNVRSSGKDEAIRLTPPKRMTLEQAISWIEEDELVEVTPKAIRIRKRYLDPNDRKRKSKSKDAA